MRFNVQTGAKPVKALNRGHSISRLVVFWKPSMSAPTIHQITRGLAINKADRHRIGRCMTGHIALVVLWAFGWSLSTSTQSQGSTFIGLGLTGSLRPIWSSDMNSYAAATRDELGRAGFTYTHVEDAWGAKNRTDVDLWNADLFVGYGGTLGSINGVSNNGVLVGGYSPYRSRVIEQIDYVIDFPDPAAEISQFGPGSRGFMSPVGAFPSFESILLPERAIFVDKPHPSKDYYLRTSFGPLDVVGSGAFTDVGQKSFPPAPLDLYYYNNSSLSTISADGLVGGGSAVIRTYGNSIPDQVASGTIVDRRAVTWSGTTEMTNLPLPFEYENLPSSSYERHPDDIIVESSVTGLSRNGHFKVGLVSAGDYFPDAAYDYSQPMGLLWTGYAVESLGPATSISISASGDYVVGKSPSGGFVWTREQGRQAAPNGINPVAVSDDGRIVGEFGGHAQLYDATLGVLPIKDFLINNHGLSQSLAGWTLTSADQISPNGRRIAGKGINPSGQPDSWAVDLRQRVYIDWGTASSRIPYEYSAGESFFETGPSLKSAPESGMAYVKMDDRLDKVKYRQDVQNEVQRIFHADGIDSLEFVNERTPDAAVIYMASREWHDAPKDTHVGQAIGVDRFNRVANDVAVVFGSADTTFATSEYAAKYDADFVAHELAHLLGLKHVTPTDSNEIMQEPFVAYDTPRFTNGPHDIDGKPVLSNHNGLYHLKRFTEGIADKQLRVETIKPGKWDDPSYVEYFNGTLLVNLDFFSDTGIAASTEPLILYDVSVFTGDSDYTSVVAEFDAISLPDLLDQTFFIQNPFEFTLLASSAPSVPSDIAVTEDGTFDAKPIFDLSSGTAHGFLTMQDAMDGSPIVLAELLITTSPATTLAADYDRDLHVDGLDFLRWQRGESPNPLSASDFADWKSQFGDSFVTAANAPVPEPNAAEFFVGGTLGLMASRHSWRRASGRTAAAQS